MDVYYPKRNVNIDQMFWHNRSVFAGTQEQLDELRRDADARAAARARAQYAQQLAAQRERRAAAEQSMLEAHRPFFKRLKPIVHVGLVPMLWTITTCNCGDRWPCNSIKQHLRSRLGWTVDITEPLKTLTDKLPKPATRWTRLRRALARPFRRRTPAPTGPAATGAAQADPAVEQRFPGGVATTGYRDDL